MTLVRWLRSVFASRPASRTRPAVRRLTLEPLEDRITPSTGGLPDPTFGSGGQVLTSFSNNYDQATAVVAQPDGKIVIAGDTTVSGSRTKGDFLVARYNADGSLDTSFGSGGHTATDFGNSPDTAEAVALQPQANGTSKILVAGLTATSKGINEVALARYNADGTLDTTFGTKGKVITSLGGSASESVTSIAVDSSGRILVAGYANGNATLIRYTANGALDTSFGSGGKLITNIQVEGRTHSVGLVVQPDDKIVLSGDRLDPAIGTYEFVTARFNANGTADSTFGTGGVVTTLVGGSDEFGGLAIQTDGKLVLAGSETDGSVTGIPLYLVRYNTDGTLDKAFGSGGVVSLTDPAGIVPTAHGVVVQSDGSIVVGGDMGDAVTGQNAFFAVRVSPTGALDTGYGNGGWASADFIYGGGGALATALQPDGALLVAGYMRSTTNLRPMDVALVRFLGSAPQVGSFTANPNPVPSGGSTTLSASNISDGNPNSTITQVAFYLDSNNDGVLDAGDALLGDGSADGLGNWLLNVSTAGWSATDTIFAQARDNYGVLGDPVKTTVTLQ